MENQDNNKSKDIYSKIIITQCICVAVILLTALTTKYFFKATFEELKKWYNNNFLIDTSISEVTEEKSGDISEV